jgi:hypothetical protein
MTAKQEELVARIDAILETESRSRHFRPFRTPEAAQRLLARLRHVTAESPGRGLAL